MNNRNSNRLIGYVLVDYTRKQGTTTTSLINLGNPLEHQALRIISNNDGVLSANGTPLTNSRDIRGYASINIAKQVAERLTQARLSPAEFTFAQYEPKKDRFEIRVVPVVKSSQGISFTQPVYGSSHAAGTFSFRKDGKREITPSVRRRIDLHHNDKRIARVARKAPEI